MLVEQISEIFASPNMTQTTQILQLSVQHEEYGLRTDWETGLLKGVWYILGENRVEEYHPH